MSACEDNHEFFGEDNETDVDKELERNDLLQRGQALISLLLQRKSKPTEQT
ncbi:unnamed protein product, partial [Brassica rapa subsp. trilocularis]